MITTDNKHPDLGRGVDESPVPQNKAYLVLTEEERQKGFVRPYREAYRHVGLKARGPLRDLTAEEQERYKQWNYVKFEAYPESESPLTGRFWTQRDLDNRGCGTKTTMARPIAETYASNPHFYGSTYCCQCQMHRPLAEFVWIEADGSQGPTLGT